MQITPKDIVYLLTYFVTLGATIAGFIYRIRMLEYKCKRVERALFHENGGLNLIERDVCKLNRDEVFMAIRKGEKLTESIIKEIRLLNDNVLRIMIHLKIDSTIN